MLSYSRFIKLLLALFFYFFLSSTYVFYLNPLYGYSGFDLNPSVGRIILSIFAIALFCFITKDKNILGWYHSLILSLILIPSMVMYSFGGSSISFFVATLFCCVIVLLFSSFNIKRTPKLFDVDMDALLKVFSFFVFLYLASIVFQGGIRYLNFNLSLVYDVRNASSDNLNPIYGYISPIVGKVLVPLIIVVSVVHKKWFYAILGISFSVLIFGFTAHKSPLFYPFVILFVYFLSRGNMGVYILLGCLFLVFISFLDFLLTDSGSGETAWLGSLFARRAIMVPVLLNGYYIDFFISNPAYYWSESKFSFGLVESPYMLSSVNLIGDVYFARSEMSANTGWIGSGFANASWWGAFIYSIFIGIILSFFCAVGRKVGERFVFSSSLIVVIAILQSTDLTTSLLTHGLLFLMVVYLFIPKGVLK